MQTGKPRLRCYLFGAETLLVECGETLLRQGHEIVGVVTTAPKIRRWAADRNLKVVDGGANYREALAAEPFDFLFSITHLALIPADVLSMPERGAINFHDGPLPRYAGLNTPVWALLNGETEYAVSWHYMTAGIDEGDVLLQKPVEIGPADTALSLNTKCFQAGIESFGELLGYMAAGPLVPRSQDFSERREYSKHDRPVGAGFIDWTQPAHKIGALVRALNHGRYKNPVAAAKLSLHGAPYVVSECVISDDSFPRSEPGEIVAVDDREIRVAVGGSVVGIRELHAPCGRPLPIAEFVALHGLKPGDRFDRLSAGEIESRTVLNAALAPGEAYWTRRLAKLDAASIPYVENSAPYVGPVAGAAAPLFQQAATPLPPAFVDRFAGGGAAEAVVCAWAAYLARVGDKTSFDLAFTDARQAVGLAGHETWTAGHVPLRIDVDPSEALIGLVARSAPNFAEVRKRRTYLKDLVGRMPDLHHVAGLAAGTHLPVLVELVDANPAENRETLGPATGAPLRLSISIPAGELRWTYDAGRVPAAALETIRAQFERFLKRLSERPTDPLGDVELLSGDERRRLLVEWNAGAADYPRWATVQALFARQAAETPDDVALTFENRSLTYRQLDERSDRLAAHLRSLGVGPDRLVGVHLERSERLVVAVLGILKAGGAYLPLDPNYPHDRIAFMLVDAAAPVIITERETVARLPPHAAQLVLIDEDWSAIERASPHGGVASQPHHLAYCIYTSGSTGKPKGVLIEHRNVVNFFAGMDRHVDRSAGRTWMAVTSLSFDIHVLELLWTLCRGFQVIVYRDREREQAAGAESARPARPELVEGEPLRPATPKSSRKMDFSLFYFSADAEEDPNDKYRLLIEGAKYADAHGFCAVWTPERHFHSFGGLYPNPAVTGAAVAAVTKHVQVRAGSIVLPLHHPIRAAECWSMVDNLSHGRAAIAVAAGWQPNDFVLMPQNYADAKSAMFRDLELVKRLWRGETVEFPGATGKPLGVKIHPRPIQKELPTWITTAGNIETYRAAGRIGANVLTHLLGQSVDDLVAKIAAYRQARAENGFDPDAGIVSLMLHTFVGRSAEEVRAVVRDPLKAYLGTSLSLLKQYAWAFPAFKRPQGVDAAGDKADEFNTLSAEEQDALLDFAFERYYETSGLFGTPEDCGAMVERLKSIGVDEIACLIDFGVPTATVLESLPRLNEVRRSADSSRHAADDSGTEVFGAAGELSAGASKSGPESLAAQMLRHGVTHLQCTPSLARMLASDDEGRAAIRRLENFFVGGEALPVDLAGDLRSLVGGKLVNMYGPTETTVWSSAQVVGPEAGAVPIGRPLSNQQLYILDARRHPVPVGVPGELFIGGDGVTRGYLNRPELSAERFVDDPFALSSGAKMYRTGDLVRFRADGTVEFLGRTDHQVKIRGHRIELGEIEARLSSHAGVRQTVVVPREAGPGDVRLVAYFVSDGAAPADADLRAHVREKLPDYMVPQHFVVLDALPLTPNGKIDRKALPPLDLGQAAPAGVNSGSVAYAAPEGELEAKIAALWQELLGRASVGVDDNFFDLGGHSLLVVRAHRQLAQAIDVPVALTDLFRFPTVRALAGHLAGGAKSEAVDAGTDRARQRRESMQRRRTATGREK